MIKTKMKGKLNLLIGSFIKQLQPGLDFVNLSRKLFCS